MISADEILSNEITVFKDRVRVDVQTSTPGLSFSEAWQRKEVMVYNEQPFYIVSKSDLIAAKRASGREVDLQDVQVLELDTKD